MGEGPAFGGPAPAYGLDRSSPSRAQPLRAVELAAAWLATDYSPYNARLDWDNSAPARRVTLNPCPAFGYTCAMDAQDLLKRMAEAYARAATYVDQGLVSTLFIQKRSRWEHRRPFRTWFERPSFFRFEFRTEGFGLPRAIMRNGGATSTYRGEEEEVETSLMLAVARLTGVSGGSSLRIPRLLMPEETKGWALTDLEKPVDKGPEVLEAIRCHRITGLQGDQQLTIWIDTEQFLVRRIFKRAHLDHMKDVEARKALRDHLRAAGIQEKRLPPTLMAMNREDFDTETTTMYSARINDPLDRGVFQSDNISG